MVEIKQDFVIDPKRTAYRSFFDHAWYREIDAVVAGTDVAPIVFELATGWRAASNTFRIPWMTVEQTASFTEGYMQARNDPEVVSKLRQLSTMLTAEIARDFPGEVSERALFGIQSYLKSVLTATQASRPALGASTDRDEIWAGYLETAEFQINLTGSQPLAYAAVFFAYEDFVAQCYRLASGNDGYEVDRYFRNKLLEVFDQTTTETCWGHPHVQIAKQVRNAIVHNGRRVPRNMLKQKHSIRVHEGRFQIMPDNTRRLFDSLKVRASTLAKETLRLANERADGGA